MNVKLAYGVRAGKIVHISEIAPEEKGEKCNCLCPECNGVLIAKLKDDCRQRHFAHKAYNNCDISHAQQTGLHLLAKEIIQENNAILVPGFTISRSELISGTTDHAVANTVKIDLPKKDAQRVEYDAVDIQKSLGDIIADAVITVKGRAVVVEIAVTHFVDEVKTKKLEALMIPAFEINLSGLIESVQTRELIAEAVLSEEANRQWVFNPKRESLLVEKKAEFQTAYAAELQKRELSAKQKKETKQKNLRALQKLMEPVNYQNELRRLRNDERAAWWLKRFAFSDGLTEYPFYMDIPITGEVVFSCDRRIWQGKLFEDYVFNCFGNDSCIFGVSEIQKRISKEKLERLKITYDKQRAYHTIITIGGTEKEVSFSYDVVRQYFNYLDLIGFVSNLGYNWYSKKPVSMEPPNTANASLLSKIIESVDSASPNIDEIIKKELLSRLPEDEKNSVLQWEQR